MRFFTPDLYRRFNSANDREADRADEEWEAALVAYQTHLDGLRDRMSSQVKKLATLSLHDAELLAVDQTIGPSTTSLPKRFPFWYAIGIISVAHEGQIVSLIYLLSDAIREHHASRGWPFSRERPQWLYDEIDISSQAPGTFLHRVLLSDGRVLEIPFASAIVHRLPFPQDGERGLTRRSA